MDYRVPLDWAGRHMLHIASFVRVCDVINLLIFLHVKIWVFSLF
jgi:hypothetical protein